MSVNLKKEHITLSEVICSQYCQTTVESDIIVPDIKPDLLKVLQISSDVVVNQKNIQNDRIYVQGIVRINILYIPESDGKNCVKSIMSVQDFSHSIDVKGVKPGMKVTVEAECEVPEYTLVNSRKVNVRNKIGINIKVFSPTEIDIATGVDSAESIQTKGSHMKICNSCFEGERDIIVREQLEVPTGKMDLAEILKFSAKPVSTEVRAGENKVIIKGDIKICTLYSGNEEDSSVQFMEHLLQFAESVEVEGVRDGMLADVEYSVKDIYYEIRQDNDGDNRILGVEITLCALIKVSEIVEIDALWDAYGIEKNVLIKKETFNLEQLIENTFSQITCKETVAIPDFLPDLYQICDCSAFPAIENISIENDSITVSGNINTSILYLSPDAELPVANFNHIMPFCHTFEVLGINKDSICDAKAEIEHLSYTMNGTRYLELRVIVSIGIKAVDSGKTELICSLDWDDDNTPSKQFPSAIIYFVQKDDTLWDIAKRYKTTQEAIISNNGTEKEILKAGKCIYIFK